MKDFSSLQSLLFLGILHQFLAGDEQTLSSANTIHVAFGDVDPIGQLTEILEMFIRERDPEGILVEKE